MIIAYHHHDRDYCILWNRELHRWFITSDDFMKVSGHVQTLILPIVAKRFIKSNCHKVVLPAEPLHSIK